jgi:hypothetical protein
VICVRRILSSLKSSSSIVSVIGASMLSCYARGAISHRDKFGGEAENLATVLGAGRSTNKNSVSARRYS